MVELLLISTPHELGEVIVTTLTKLLNASSSLLVPNLLVQATPGHPVLPDVFYTDERFDLQ